jgi:hypothetical protein
VGNRPRIYHPERHYMRGPGPKYHAKHAELSGNAAAGKSRSLPYSIWIVPVASAALLGAVVMIALA